MKLSKGFIEQNLSHQFGVNMKIRLAGLNIVVSQHLFDFKNGAADLKKILSICMPEPIG
jgi:hypothetical protein